MFESYFISPTLEFYGRRHADRMSCNGLEGVKTRVVVTLFRLPVPASRPRGLS